jgi:hypothetical protein
MVRQGLIPRVVLPGMKQGVYPQRDVDALARSVNEPEALFEFSPSSPADLAEELLIAQRYADRSAHLSLTERLAFQQKTHFAFYSLKVRGRVVASLAMFRLSEHVLDHVLTGRMIFQNIRVSDLLPFTRLEPFRVYLDTMMVDPTLSLRLRRVYAGIALYKAAEVLLHLLGNDYQITGLYTVPYTPEGERLVQKLGFQAVENQGLVPERKAYMYLLQDVGLQRLRQITVAYRHLASSGD